MEVVVSVFAVLVAMGCFYAIYRSDRKDAEQDKQAEEKDD
jgi:preprotein translocase subunit YajC